MPRPPLFAALLLVAFAAALAAPGGALAHDPEEHEDSGGGVLVRIDGSVHVAAGESVGTVVVINDEALIEGVVENALVVINGDAEIYGTVEGTVTIVRGDLELFDGALVEDDVILVNSDLTQAPTATIAGDIEERDGWLLGWTFGVGFALGLWAALTLLALVAALLFAAIAGRQLNRAASNLTERPLQSLAGVLVVWILVPVVAVAAFITLIGIPTGISLLVVLLPALWVLGYLVTGAWLGRFILGIVNREVDPEHPYLAAFTGVFALQVIAFIPGLGWIVGVLAALWGSGGLAALAWGAFRGRPPAPAEPLPSV